MTPDALVAQLSVEDFNIRAQALAGLVRLGRAASPALRPLLDGPDARLRVLAAQALAEIGNPADAEIFARALHDPTPEIRARAAQGLATIGDPRTLGALVQTLNDLPDVLHHPATLATHLLTGYGAAALPQMMPLLKADDLVTRQRAWLVVQSIVARRPDTANGPSLLQALGGYRPDSPKTERDAAAARGQAWLANR